jgi:hypothetical protein
MEKEIQGIKNMINIIKDQIHHVSESIEFLAKRLNDSKITDFHCGDVFNLQSSISCGNHYYILARQDSGKQLIGLNNGNHWLAPVNCSNYFEITVDEWHKITGNNVFTRIDKDYFLFSEKVRGDL